MFIPEFVECSFCKKRLEYWKESKYMTSPNDQDDVPFCDSHWEEYYNKRQKLLEELYKYYTQPERSKREDFKDINGIWNCGCREVPGEFGLHIDCKKPEHINYDL